TENLLKDIGSTVLGIAPGIYEVGKPLYNYLAADVTFDPERRQRADKDLMKIGKAVAKSYQDYYGHDVLHPLYTHPLQPILDVATVASLGAGGVAKGGSLLAKAGAISPESGLARLGARTTLTTRSPAAVKGEEGADVLEEISSTRPLVKGRQVLCQKVREHP